RKFSWYRAHEAERMRTSEYMEANVYESAFDLSAYRDRLRDLGCPTVYGRWCGVYPWRLQNYPRVRPMATRVSAWLDGSWIAERYGWYFMLLTMKPQRPPTV